MAKFHSSLWLSSIPLWASLVAQLVKNPPAMQEALDGFLSQKITWRTDRLPTPVLLGFPGGSDPPAVQGTWIQYLFWEDPLEESMATHSSNLAWRIPWTGCLTGHLPWGHKESDTTEQLSRAQYSIIYIYHIFIFSSGASISWQL